MNYTRNEGLASNTSQTVGQTSNAVAMATANYSLADTTNMSAPAVTSAAQGAAAVVAAAAATANSTDDSFSVNASQFPGKLFCWALMMPHGYEVSLMRTLLGRSAGIFGCNAYDVFSSGDIELSPGPPLRIGTTDIGSVKCNYGGKWHLALNSPVFIKVWKKVFEMRTYLQADWTVKVDPDAVFIPERLREQMLYSDPDACVYFNNCDQGLHGPIEVLARGGMRKFGAGIRKCEKKLEHEFWEFGEDVFLRHCLGILKVYRVDNFRLLSEDRCMWEDPARTGCYSGKVAFHPFKSPEKYFVCLKQALDKKKHEDESQGDDKNETNKL